MKEPIDLIRERLLEIQSVLSVVGDEDVFQINRLTELHNRYVSAYNLINSNLFSKSKSESYEPNKSELLLKIIDNKNKQLKKQRKKTKKYYSRWHHIKTRNKNKREKTNKTVYKNETKRS